jgi:hypothetical protein
MAEDKYKKLINDMLNNVKKNRFVSEGRIKYDSQHKEKMLPKLERELRERKHSLGDHPTFPESDEMHFEEKIMVERFTDVIREVKRHFNINDINNNEIISDMGSMLGECIKVESKHKKELEELAIKMVRDEYNIPEDLVDIEAKLVDKVDMKDTKLTPKQIGETDFDSYEDIQNLNGEVYKRRFLNAMNQGAAMKTNHMYHMADNELPEIDPTLPTKYGRMMSAAEYMYYITDNIDTTPTITGGIVRLELPMEEGGKPKIKAEGMVFPVLLHELIKGVMELLASHALPESPEKRDYVINKADYLKAEPWDMRLGPALWSKFTNAIPPEDFHLKHYLYCDLCQLPVEQFNETMKEILAGTKRGKNIINDMLTEIKTDLQRESFNRTMDERRQEVGNDSGYIENPDELDDFWGNMGI